MTKLCFRLLILLFPVITYAKSNSTNSKESLDKIAFEANCSVKESDRIINYIPDSTNNILIEGNISSIFHEQIDSVWIIYRIEDQFNDSLFSNSGKFYIIIPKVKRNKLIEIEFRNPEFHLFDTSMVLNSDKRILCDVEMTPKYKISLRGRVFAGNVPVQGVNVIIKLKDKEYHIETRGCYYDKDNYWNCLYNGMFLQDLVIENTTDSIKLYLEKEGLRPMSVGMVLSDYTGEIELIKMKYDKDLSINSKNCLNLKLGIPYLSIEKNWFVDLSYYRTFAKKYLDRISLGIDGNLLLSTISNTITNFQENSSSFDTSYISGYLGPSALFWLRKPDKRYFSTYLGVTAGIGLDDADFFIQPFIGTRIFVDFNKAISIEIRHVPYDIEVVDYTFNAFGNAYRSVQNKEFKDFLLDIGIQIAF